MSKGLDPDQALAVCKGYLQIIKVAASKEQGISRCLCWNILDTNQTSRADPGVLMLVPIDTFSTL